MKNISEMKLYLASPWFNDTQAEREGRVKNKLEDLGFCVFSPRDSNALNPMTATEEQKEKTFSVNISTMEKCDIIFAITDEKDMGTIWEAGFVYGLRHERMRKEYEFVHPNSPVVVYYCETLGNNQFNLMLAKSGDIVITDFNDLDKLPILITKGEVKHYVGIVE